MIEKDVEVESSEEIYTYRGIHEKGSGDVVSALCYTIYTLAIP